MLKNLTDVESSWPLPINYATHAAHNFSDVTADFWLTSPEQTILVSNITSNDWFIVNKQQQGTYCLSKLPSLNVLLKIYTSVK